MLIRDNLLMDNLSYSESIVIESPPETVYEMVADITRMGEWSPVCKKCWWDDDANQGVGSWFTGRNEMGERTWETRSQVVAAVRGHEFAFIVGGDRTRWGYRFEALDGGTKVTESWEFLPGNVVVFKERYGDNAESEIANRLETAKAGIHATLSAIKKAAEAA